MRKRTRQKSNGEKLELMRLQLQNEHLKYSLYSMALRNPEVPSTLETLTRPFDRCTRKQFLLAASLSVLGLNAAQSDARQQGANNNPLDNLEKYGDINNTLHRELGITLSKRNSDIIRYLIQHLDARVPSNNCFARFGISDAVLNTIRSFSTRAVISPAFDYVPKLGISGWAQKFTGVLDTVISTYPVVKSQHTLQEYLVGCMVSDWVRTHMITDGSIATAASAERIKRYDSDYVVSLPVLSGVCADYASLTRNLARACGLKAYYNSGYPRPISGIWPNGFNHSWVIIEFSDGTLCPSENTHTRVSVQNARKLDGQIHDPRSMPVSAWEYAVFTALYYGKCEANDRIGDKQNIRTLTNVDFDIWKALPVFPDFKEICLGYDAKWRRRL